VREGDEVAGFGGGEFAILMPGISRREADLQASTLSTGLNGLIVPWNGKVIQVSSSVGGACYGPDDDMHTIYRRADEEMYRHKNDSMSIRLASGKHDAQSVLVFGLLDLHRKLYADIQFLQMIGVRHARRTHH
jgi:GGDEF domain-containing protein